MKTWWLWGAIIIALGIGIWIFLVSSDEPEIKMPTAGRKIIAFGDSLVEGVGASEGDKDFVSILARRLGLEIVNAGRSGDTTATALERLERAVLLQDPRIVLVLLGGNDALRRTPKEETRKNLALIIDRIQAQGAAVLLLGVRGEIFRDDYRQIFEGLAKEKGAGLIPNVLEDIFGHADLMSDPIHPNDEGYAQMAERIEPVLRKMLE